MDAGGGGEGIKQGLRGRTCRPSGTEYTGKLRAVQARPNARGAARPSGHPRGLTETRRVVARLRILKRAGRTGHRGSGEEDAPLVRSPQALAEGSHAGVRACLQRLSP